MTDNVRHQLRHRTRHAHDALDAALDLLGPPLGLEQYARLLGRFLGFHRAIEPPMFARLDPSLVLGRSKLAALEADLLACHQPWSRLATLPTPATLPPIDTRPAALGALYVTEGSTLGGRLILRHIAINPAIPNDARSYFDIYGDNTGARWQATCLALDGLDPGPDTDSAIDTATRLFDRLRTWLAPQAWR